MSSARPQSDLAEAELLSAIARRDEQALSTLYDRYSSILFGLLLRILHSRPEAEDVLQEVYLQIWQRAASFDFSRGRPFTWLVTLARSRAIDRLRMLESRERTARASVQESPPEADEAAADDLAIRTEQREILEGALAQLPEEQRRTLLLAYLNGLSQSEIAQKTGEPLGTVKTRTRAGLMKLNELLRGKFSGFGTRD